MRIALIIMAHCLILVVALLASREFSALRRKNSFTAPYTRELIRRGIIPGGDEASVLREDTVLHAVGIALCVLVAVMLTLFFTGPLGAAVFLGGFAACLLVFRPDQGNTPENRRQYYNTHKSRIDPVKYHAYLEEIGDTGDEARPGI